MRALTLASLLAAATGAAWAQGSPSTGSALPATQAPLFAAVPEMAQAGGRSDGSSTLPSEQLEGELLSSDLVGRPLHGRDGRRLGEIADVLIGRDRRLAAVVAVVDAGAGNRGRSVAIPFDALRRTGDRRDVRLIADVDEGRLRNAKAFEPLSREAGQDDNQDLTVRGGAATGGSVPPAR